MRPIVLPHPPFPDHALLDSGAGEKLERFGRIVVRRPDPQAVWKRAKTDDAWARADLAFERESDRGGRWIARDGAPQEAQGDAPEWPVTFGDAVFVLRPTPFKHLGLFPEQATNWVKLVEAAPRLGATPRLLNLFGYTGAASVIAAQAGYAVTHVDASRASLAWTRENAVRSGLAEDAVRVLLDDALAFARREVRRENRYEAILVDPPHYGRGPKGEKWQFEDHVAPLMEAVGALLAERSLVVLSTYAVGFSPLTLDNLLSELPGLGALEVGELALPGEDGRRLPAGFCGRAYRGWEGA